MCVSAIYGTIVVNHLIVTNYIGDSRLRLYLYPHGRGQLYYSKNIVFVVSFGALHLLGTFMANALYVFGESFFPILVPRVSVSTYLVDFILSSIIGTLLTISIVLFSSFVGIRFSSLVATIVTGIILVAMGGNLIATAFANYRFVTFIATLFISVLVFIGVIITGIRINKDEVFI